MRALIWTREPIVCGPRNCCTCGFASVSSMYVRTDGEATTGTSTRARIAGNATMVTSQIGSPRLSSVRGFTMPLRHRSANDTIRSAANPTKAVPNIKKRCAKRETLNRLGRMPAPALGSP